MSIDLDAIITATPAGGTIKLSEGVYTTRGVNESGSANPGAQLKAGVSLIGKGQGRTVVMLVQPEDRSLNTLWGLGGNTVSDLTIDCGVWKSDTSYSNGKRNGLFLEPGSKPNRVSRVTVLKPYGNFSTRKEGFGLIIWGSRSAITDCLVHDPKGDYVQAFSCVGSAMVQNCRVHFPLNQPVGGGLTCFGQSEGTNVNYLNCYSSGGAASLYYDTGDIKNLRVEGCTFTDAPVGIYLKNQYQPTLTQHVTGVRIKNNQFLLASVDSLVVGISLNNTRLDGAETTHTAGSINNVTIEGNYFGYAPSNPVPVSASGLRKAISVASNCTAPILGTCGVNNVTISGNTYQTIPSGEPWTHRNKWSAGAGITVANETALTWQTT